MSDSAVHPDGDRAISPAVLPYGLDSRMSGDGPIRRDDGGTQAERGRDDDAIGGIRRREALKPDGCHRDTRVEVDEGQKGKRLAVLHPRLDRQGQL